MVIDALDECNEQERECFLVSVGEIKFAACGKYNIFITSRPEINIQRETGKLSPVEVVVQPALVDEVLKKWPEDVKMEIENRLTSGANGM